MSGIEIAGLVLGSFPILLNCLDYYRQGFEPLEEWWNFRTHFAAFVDEVSHQMMRYHENMIRLLDPIVVNNGSLAALIRDAKDPRWTDGSLTHPLEQRLAREHGRFLRIIQRMEEDIRDLKKLLGIKDGNVHWIGSEQQRPWEWHMKRLHISFSKGKNRKVKKLAIRNQELQEILSYSERIIPIADRRMISAPVAHFEHMWQYACGMHNALSLNWKCSCRTCQTHQANLCIRCEVKTVSFNVLFILEHKKELRSKSQKQDVTINPIKEDTVAFPRTEYVGNVRQAESFTAVQKSFKNVTLDSERSSFRKRLFRLGARNKEKPSPRPDRKRISAKGRDQAQSSKLSPAFTISQGQADDTEAIPSNSNDIPSQRITDLCSCLQNCSTPNLGIIIDKFDRQFRLTRSSQSIQTVAPDSARLVALPEILDAYHQTSIELARHRRFEMALHIASSLLQIYTSPWLCGR